MAYGLTGNISADYAPRLVRVALTGKIERIQVGSGSPSSDCRPWFSPAQKALGGLSGPARCHGIFDGLSRELLIL